MKNWNRIALVCVMATSQLSYAGSPVRSDMAQADMLALQVDQGPLQDGGVRAVSALEAAQVRGKVLPYVLGVAAVDLALASFFWGVYVPFYADKEPAH